MGLGLGTGGVRGSLKDMKVLIGQRGNREVYAEGERLWNGQAFLHFDRLCASANQKNRMAMVLFFYVFASRLLLKPFLSEWTSCDVADQAMCKFS